MGIFRNVHETLEMVTCHFPKMVFPKPIPQQGLTQVIINKWPCPLNTTHAL